MGLGFGNYTEERIGREQGEMLRWHRENEKKRKLARNGVKGTIVEMRGGVRWIGRTKFVT